MGTAREIAACLGLNAQLSCEAYWQRLREGRSLFAPTLKRRPRALPRAALNSTFPSTPFLRPTPYADSRAPEIVSLAAEFRARTAGDWDYASAIFDFVCNQIALAFEIPPRRGVVGTIERGFGTCLEKLNVFVALARAGGVPARYCEIGMDPSQAGVLSLMTDDSGIFGELNLSPKRFLADENDRRAKRLVSFFIGLNSGFRKTVTRQAAEGRKPSPNRVKHFTAELRIGDGWIAADPTLSDEECAASGRPLPRFGYEPLYLGRLMGTTITARTEELSIGWRPYVFWVTHLCVSRGFFDHINSFNERERTRGRQILDQVGAEAMIERRSHLYRRASVVADSVS